MVTVTLLAPNVPAGVLAVIEVALTTTTLVAATPFTFTLVAPVKLAPVIVIDVLPLVGPDVGEIEVIVGAATYVNALAWLPFRPRLSQPHSWRRLFLLVSLL